MSVLEFVADIVRSLAWPTVVVVALVLLRKPVGNLIDRLRSATGHGFGLDFEQLTSEAKSDARAVIEEIQQQSAVADEPAPPEPEPVDLPHGEDPTFAVIAAWERVGGAVRDLVGAAASDGRMEARANAPTLRLVRELETAGMVNSRYVESVASLGRLRNSVAHGQRHLDREEAASYVEAAQELIRATSAIIEYQRLLAAQRPFSPTAGGLVHPEE